MTAEQYIYIDKYGNKYYFKDKEMTMVHRLDGPAIEYSNGNKYWFVDDKCHRLDGPAIEWSNGTKLWYVDDKCHRLDGPAIEWSNGTKLWYVDDKQLTEEEFNALTAPTLELTLEEIASKFGVNVKKLKIVK